MSSYTQRLIREGDYGEAKYQASSLSNFVSLYYQSRIAELTGHFDEALDFANNCSKFAKSDLEIVKSSIAKAYAYWRMFSFDRGHQVLDETAEFVEEIAFDNPGVAGTHFNIRGLLLWKGDKLDGAFDTFERALIYRKDAADQYNISYTLNNLGNTYLKFKDLPAAEQYYNEAYQIRTSLGYKPAVAASANSFGRLYDAMKRHEIARKNHLECLKLWDEIGNQQFIGKAFRFLAINAFNLGDQKNNQHYWISSDQCFQEIDNQIDLNTNQKLKKSFEL